MEPNTNTNNRAGIIGVIIVLLIIVIGAGAYLYYDKALAPSQESTEIPEGSSFASNCGLLVEKPMANATVSFPLTVTGRVDNTDREQAGCFWIMFEGQAGVATLHYETKDGWSLPVATTPITVDNWMSTSTAFAFTVDFDNSMLQLPSGYNFKIILTEENPSGEGTPDVVEVPVVLE